MIKRTIKEVLINNIKSYPVILVTGARQIGKSNLCYELTKEYNFNYISLDDLDNRSEAINDPKFFLAKHKAPLIIDEVQYAPILFEYIESIVNKKRLETGDANGMYVLTGSQKFKLMKNVTESMAGRVGVINMSPLSYNETIGRKDTPAKYGFLARTLAMGAIAAILIQLSHSNRKWIRKISDSFAIVVYQILTLMTLVLAFLMTSSIHFVTYFNLNVLITLPSVAMLYLHIRALFDENRFRPAIKKFAGISFRITLIVFAIKAVFSFIAIQDCLAYFTFMLMLYMAEIYEIKGTSKGN